jgi:hypothetical protein
MIEIISHHDIKYIKHSRRGVLIPANQMTYAISPLICHSRLSGVLLKKDSGQAGMTKTGNYFCIFQ